MKKYSFTTAKEVREVMGELTNLFLSDEIDERKYKTFIYGANSIIASIRVDELESKLEKLENIINEGEI